MSNEVKSQIKPECIMKSIHISLVTLLTGLGVAFAQLPTATESPLIEHPVVGEDRRTLEWGVQNCSEEGDGTEPPFFTGCEFVIRKQVGVSSYDDYLIIDGDGNLGLGEHHMQSNFNRERIGDGKARGGTHDHTMKVGMDKIVGDPGFDENILFLNDRWTNSPSLPAGVEINFSTEIKAGYLQIQQTSTEDGVDPKLTRIEDGIITSETINTENVIASTVQADVVETAKWKISSISGAPDYVFHRDHELKPLPELKAFIEENKHLPGIQSAKEMEKDGVDMVDLNMKLLEKIEEMTLYILDQEERIKKLEGKNGE